MPVANQPGPRDEPPSDDRYRFLRELGHRVVPTYAALLQRPPAKPLLVVAERLARDGGVSDADAEAMVRVARVAARVDHANVVRTVDVVVRKDDVIVASELVDGELLSSLCESRTTSPSLAVSVRILLDVLAGLEVLHELRDAKTQAPLGLVHGELTASSVLVGIDGVTRVLRACRIRRARTASSADAIAPEVASGGPVDRRADIFGVGALLWESLSEDARWAAPLADVAKRAMSVAPAERFPSAAAMSDAIRQILGAKMVPIERVAMHMKTRVGERVAQRLEALVDASRKPPPASIEVIVPEAIATAVPPTPHRATLPTPPPLRNSAPTLHDRATAVEDASPAARRAVRARSLVVAVLAACALLLGVAAWRFEQRPAQAPAPTAASNPPPPPHATEPSATSPTSASAPAVDAAPPTPSVPAVVPLTAPTPTTPARKPPKPTPAPPAPKPPPTSPATPPRFDPTRI